MSDFGVDDRANGVRFPAEAADFSSNMCPDRLWGPFNLLSKGYLGSFPGAKARPMRGADQSSHLLLRSRMSRSYTSPLQSTTMACSRTAMLCLISHCCQLFTSGVWIAACRVVLSRLWFCNTSFTVFSCVTGVFRMCLIAVHMQKRKTVHSENILEKAYFDQLILPPLVQM